MDSGGQRWFSRAGDALIPSIAPTLRRSSRASRAGFTESATGAQYDSANSVVFVLTAGLISWLIMETRKSYKKLMKNSRLFPCPCVRAVLTLVSAFLLVSPATSRADSVLANTGQGTAGGSPVNIDGSGSLAQSFITGSIDLYLYSVSLEMGNAGTTISDPLNVSIYSSAPGSSGPGSMIPGSDILDLVEIPSAIPASSEGSAVYGVSSPLGSLYELDPNTEYWIVASSSTSGDVASYIWDYTSQTSVDGSLDNVDPVSGWSLDTLNTYAYSGNIVESSPEWIPTAGDPQQFQITAFPVPEPGTWALMAMGAVVLFGFGRSSLRRAW
jgi:hypothetical protein